VRCDAALIALLVGCLVASAAGAQEASPGAAEPADERASAAEPIPLGAMFQEAANLRTWLTGIAKSFSADRARDAAREVDGVEREVQFRAQRLRARAASAYSRTELGALLTPWRRLDATLTRLERAQSAWLGELAAGNDELQRRQAVWQATAALAVSEEAPPEIKREIAQARRSLEEMRDRVRVNRDAALRLQDRMVGVHAEVSAHLKTLIDSRERVLSHLLDRNGAALWAMSPERLVVPCEQVTPILAELGAALPDYADAQRRRIVLHVALLAVLVLLGVQARGVARRLADSEGSAFPESLAHPWAAGLVLGLSAGAWIHADAESIVRATQALVLLIPWVVVVRALLPAWGKRVLPVLLGVVLLDVSRDVLAPFEELSRILLVSESAISLLTALWLLRVVPVVAPRAASPFWMSATRAWLQLVVAGSGLAVFGAVLGWVSAADVLIGGLTRASLASSILFTGVLIFETIAEVLVRAGRLASLRIVAENRVGLLQAIRRATRGVAVVTWFVVLFSTLGVHDAVRPLVNTVLTAPLGYGNFQVTTGGILAFGLTLWISRFLARLISVVFEQRILNRMALPQGAPFALATMTRYAVMVIGFLIAVSALGFELGNLALVLSALGVGIGFGLQNVVGNVVSGLILLFERPIRSGDLVQIEGLQGEVMRIGIRASVVRTFDGAEVIVPNSDLVTGRVTNWTLSDRRRRVTIPVGVSYGTPAPRVKELLLGVARENPDALSYPAPMALFTAFGESSLDFELRVWTESADALTEFRSALAEAIQEVLARENIEVPFPQRDLHVRTVDAGVQERVRPPGGRA